MVTITMTEEEARKHFSAIPELYSLDDIAAKYGYNREFIRLEVEAGVLKGFKLGKYWKFTAAGIREWIDNKQVTACPHFPTH